MTAPVRIQLSRRKGWRMPPGTVIVDRRSGWGNPYRVGVHGNAAECVALYRTYMEACIAPSHPAAECTKGALEQLRGHNLGCWCAIGEPCHADVLLEIANA